MKITKTQLKQIIMEELEEVGYDGESIMTGYPGELRLLDYLKTRLFEPLPELIVEAIRAADEELHEKILDAISKNIIGEGSSEMMSPREKLPYGELRNQVHKYLIDKKFFKGSVRNGRHFIEIFWGAPEGAGVPEGAGKTNPAREFLISAVNSGDIDWATWEEIEPIWQEINRSID